jgi:hypothetical protein
MKRHHWLDTYSVDAIIQQAMQRRYDARWWWRKAPEDTWMGRIRLRVRWWWFG